MLNPNLGKPELKKGGPMLKRTKKDENNTSFSVGDTVEEKLASSTLRPAVSLD